MRLAVFDHHDKAKYLIERLSERFDIVAVFDEVVPSHVPEFDMLLVDSDHPEAVPPGKNAFVNWVAKRGIPVALFPHGAMPDLDYDGLRPWGAPISLQLLHGEGHAEIYRRCKLKHQTAVVGWTYGEVMPSGPEQVPQHVENGGRVESILFAPIHPWFQPQNILDFHHKANIEAYRQFLEHPAERKIVRQMGDDFPNGITERVEGVEYTQSDLRQPVELIESVDAVISYGTLAYRALSMGKPTAMIFPYPGVTNDHGTVLAKHLEDYQDYVRYPASVGDAPLDELFQMDVSDWVEKFVGGPLDLDKLERVLKSFRPNRAMRRKMERMAA